LVVTYQAGLLHDDAPARQYNEVRYATDIVTFGELRIFFRVDLYYNGFPSHISSSTRDLRSSRATWTAPIRPKVYEHGDRGVLNNFIKLRIVDR
jgi:hypothetical protein